MCGICGHTSDRGGEAVARMRQLLVHRGPDDHGTYTDPQAGVSLGAQRLSIIDLEGGHQPLSNEDGSVWAVLNGEIYNHPALLRRLVERGHELSTRSDTEVLVHLYEDFGAEFVHAIEGMFALAIWDSRRRSLTLARDRFGEKPLFYLLDGDTFAFASELDALRAGAGIEAELEPRSVDAYFRLGYVPGPDTILRGFRQVPPGCLVTWDSTRRTAQVTSYWKPPTMRTAVRLGADEAFLETERLVTESVRSRLLADVPVGVFLSGGVDSALVAAVAVKDSGARIKTFTVGYDVGAVDERLAARRVARSLGTDHHEYVLRETEVASETERVLSQLDQPLADQALIALHALSRFARGSVKVAVGGEGADELFGGYPRYRWLQRAETVGDWLPAGLARRSATLLRGSAPARGRDRLAAFLSPQSTLERNVDWLSGTRARLRPELYGPALRVELAPKASPGGRNAGDGPSVAELLMQRDQVEWLPDDILAKADRASMRASLEFRTPYLNRELAELTAKLPLEGGGPSRRSGKRLLAKQLQKEMPDWRWRPKAAFRVPAAEWLSGPLAAPFAAQLEHSTLYSEEWFDRRGVRRLHEQHVSGTADWSGVLWPLMALGFWLDRVRGSNHI